MVNQLYPHAPTPAHNFASHFPPLRAGSRCALRSLDVVITRGGVVESRHRVHAAIVRSDGVLLAVARDSQLVTWWRSCAKPFQIMPLVEDGGIEALGWGADELALACGSHGGEPEHVALAGAMLARVGLEEGDLACGPHEPLSARGSRLLRESGHRLTRLHNNCSGKHAAMLARASLTGEPAADYQRASHPVQQAIRRTIVSWTDVESAQLLEAVDGCGVTVFGLPLVNMALAYARLALAAQHDPVAQPIVRAMTAQPFLVGGTDRFDTLLMQATDGRVLCKVGAEGVHSVALLDQGIGFALKVEDGAQRAQYPAVLALLQSLDALPAIIPDALQEFAVRAIRNTRGELVGEIGMESR